MSDNELELLKKYIKELNENSLKINAKNAILSEIDLLQVNTIELKSLEHDYISGRITQDTYLTRKKINLTEKIMLQNQISEKITTSIEKTIDEKKKPRFVELKNTLNASAQWIKIILDLVKIYLMTQ